MWQSVPLPGDATSVVHAEAPPSKPLWLKGICLQRKYFAGHCLVVRSSSGSLRFFQFIFAYANPYLAWFCPLTQVLSVNNEAYNIIHAGNWSEVVANTWKWQFKRDIDQMWSWDQVSGLPFGADPCIIPEVLCLKGELLYSDHEMMEWADFVELLPEVKTPPPEEEPDGARTKKPKAKAESSFSEPGWLREHKEREKLGKKPALILRLSSQIQIQSR